jgi:hypothetical protein
MTSRLLFTLLFLPLITFAQKDSSRFRPGIEVSGIYSSISDFGLVPTLTAAFENHRLAFGVRAPFDPFLKKQPLYLDHSEYVFLLSYRYYPAFGMEKLQPFVQAQLEYGVYNSEYSYTYDTTLAYSYGPGFDHNIQGRQEYDQQQYALCIGPGIDFFLWKGLYLTATAGAGLGSRRWKHEIVNDNGTMEYSEDIGWQVVHLEWFASAGVGYRF